MQNKTNTDETAHLTNKYQQKTDKEHILSNPDTYIGSVEQIESELWILHDQENKIIEKKINYIPGLFKLFDEGIVNCRDHVIRMQQAVASNIPNSLPVTSIDISIQEDGTISMMNDGNGIDVAEHPEYKIWIPELIFGHLRTSTNYDKNEKKIVGGKNGFGFKLVLIWSVFGSIETIDHVRGLKYYQEFKNNLDDIGKPKITKCASKKPYTKITFKPDYARLGISGLTTDMISLLKKRVYDVAAITDKSIKVKYNSHPVPVKNFQHYVDLYIQDTNAGAEKAEKTEKAYEDADPRWEYAVALSPTQEFIQVSFVNGIHTSKGGKHVEYILNQITRKLITYIEKKKKVVVSANSIKEQIVLFLRCDIENPAFDSQTKDYMNTPANKFGSTCSVSDKFIEKIAKMGIMDSACALTEIKENKSAKKTDGSKTKNIRGIPKLMDANWAGTEKSSECMIILCEGDSAKAGIVSGLSSEDRNTIGVYPMKGKIMNVRGEQVRKIAENKEIAEIKKILGLETGKEYNTIQDVAKSLRYSKIVIMCDADHDGSHIKGLCANLFHSEWATLTTIPGFIGFMNTPILKARKGQQEMVFYNEGEYNVWKQHHGEEKGWNIKYYKGLGTSTGKEFREYFKNKKLVGFSHNGEKTNDAIDMVFNKKRADDRKDWLKEYNRENYLDTNKELVPYEEFIDKELIHFSKYDCDRSIPNLMDGLKISLRKILYSAFKRNLTSEIKVAQFSGYVSEHSGYHHGESSLHKCQISMAQNFVGTNNINLLEPKGQFGCLSPDTPILMWNGSIKPAKEIIIGDVLVGDDGNPRNVLRTTSGIDEMFEICDIQGKKMVVNSQHILTLYFEKNNKIIWKDNMWIIYYFDNITIKSKCIKPVDEIKIYKSNHKSNISKEDALIEMKKFQNNIIMLYNSSKIIDIKLEEYNKLSNMYKNQLYMVSNYNNINWKKQNVTIDPYIFGAWLGDGDHDGTGFTSIDEELIKSYVLWADTINGEITHKSNKNRNDYYRYGIRRKNSGISTSIGDENHSSLNCIGCITSKLKLSICDFKFEKTTEKCNYGVTSNGQKRSNLNPFSQILKKNNLYKNKHIPLEYIYNDEETRLQLLAGFIDTDGHINQNNTSCPNVQISQSERQHGLLIDQLNIIAQSLGFATSITYSKKNKQTKINKLDATIKTLKIFGKDIEKIPTKLFRKKIVNLSENRIHKEYNYTQFNVKPLGKGEFYGWSINENERFLLGNFVVTHNSRLAGGSDHASERYIFTHLCKITRTIFPQQDDAILKYLDDDGMMVEPVFYAPILPMVLVNGSKGIGTGFSTEILCYNPLDILDYLKQKLSMESGPGPVPTLDPYYEGFKGTIQKIAEKKYLVKGKYVKLANDKIHITELPVGTWNDDFKEYLETLADGTTDKSGKKMAAIVKDYDDMSKDTNVDFIITLQKGKVEELEAQKLDHGCNGLEKMFKLFTTMTTTNMHLFDAQEKLKKYDNVESIIDDYYETRLQLYQVRKEYLIKILTKELMVLSNKTRYIQEILDEVIDLRKKKREEVFHMLQTQKYDILDDDEEYKYLVKMSMDAVTAENVEKMKKENQEKADELNHVVATGIQKMWMQELDVFEKEYLKYKEERERIMNGDSGDGEKKKSVVVKKKLVIKKAT